MLQSVKKYNGLNGTFKRAELEGLAIELEADEQYYLKEKILNALNANPDKSKFEITLENKAIQAAQISGLSGVEFMQESDENGLNKPVSPEDIYKMITEKMIQEIEEASGFGYVKKWHEDGYMIPVNFVSKKTYRGINRNLLSMFGMINFKNPYFLTFKQIEKLGGKVKKGAKGREVIYFSKLFLFEQSSPDLKIGTYDAKKFISYLNKNKSKVRAMQGGLTANDIIKKSVVPLLKYYKVFNGEDVTGIDFKLDEYKAKFSKDESQRVEAADLIIKNYPKPAPTLKHGGDRAFYRPSADLVQMPKISDFTTEEDYYRTLLHEYSHSTGHKDRLDRLKNAAFGSPDYAFEELVAEFGAVFLSAEAGIMWRNNSNHAEYLKNWKNALPFIKDDNKLIMRASSEAQKATDFILQPDENGVHKYLQNINVKKEVEKVLDVKTDESFDFSDPKTYENDLDYETLKRSRYWSSFDPEKNSKYEIKSWIEYLTGNYNEKLELAKKNNIDQALLDAGYLKFWKRILKAKNKLVSARSKVISSAVTGGSNFPVRKAKAASSRYHDVTGEYFEVIKKGNSKLKQIIYPVSQIKQGDKNAVILLNEKINAAINLNEKAKYFNKNLKGEKSTKEEKINFIAENNLRDLLNTVFPNAGGKNWIFESAINDNEKLVFMYLTKAINDLKKKVKAEELRNTEIKDLSGGWIIAAGEVILNEEANRVQILFNEKPDEETRSKLKKNGFRWSPKFTAWQRQMTRNAIFITKRLFPEVEPDNEPEPPTEKNKPKEKEPAPKIDANGQFGLFGKNKNGLNAAWFPKKFKTVKEARVFFSKWALENLRGKEVYLKEIDKTVIFNRKGIDHSIKAKSTIEKAALIIQSEQLLRRSTFLRYEKENRNRDDIKGVYRMKANAKIGDTFEKVIITLREGSNGVIYYDHKIDDLSALKKPYSATKGVNTIVGASNKADSSKEHNKDTKKSPKANKGLKGVKNSLLDRENKTISEREFFKLLPKYNDLSEFFGMVEVQEKESAIMTLSAPQGAGKTTVLFQMMNAFAESGYKCNFASLEEHPNSYLFEKKADQYLSDLAQANITAPYYSKNSISQFLEDIKAADVIFIDSMKKLWQYLKGFDLDNDLRKAFDGKLFVIIFQLTSDGKMRGGSDAQFDGDIISFIQKEDRFEDNYLYHDKNRYAIKPIHETKYNIVNQRLINNNAENVDLKKLKYDVC